MAAEFSRKTGEVCYHEAMESARTSIQLQREVLPPQTAEQGLGVLVLVSTAMFCAVLSSAFVLQARNARHCPGTAPAASLPSDHADEGAGTVYSVDELPITSQTAHALVEVIEASLEADLTATVQQFPADSFGGGQLDVGTLGATDAPTDGADQLLPGESVQNCGKPMYQKNADGSVTAKFGICPDSVDAVWVLKSAEYRE